jgi:hypothetical protein
MLWALTVPVRCSGKTGFNNRIYDAAIATDGRWIAVPAGIGRIYDRNGTLSEHHGLPQTSPFPGMPESLQSGAGKVRRELPSTGAPPGAVHEDGTIPRYRMTRGHALVAATEGQQPVLLENGDPP